MAVLGGQPWRLLSAHTVHLGWAHCLVNAGGLALCGAFAAGPRSWCAWATAIIVLAVDFHGILTPCHDLMSSVSS